MRLELKITGKSKTNLINGLLVMIDDLVKPHTNNNAYIPLNDTDNTEIDYSITEAIDLFEESIILINENILNS